MPESILTQEVTHMFDEHILNKMQSSALGEGSYASVFPIDEPEDKRYPAKVVKCNRRAEYDFWKSIAEFDIHNMLNGHPNIIKFIKCCQKLELPKHITPKQYHDEFYFIMERGQMCLGSWLGDRRIPINVKAGSHPFGLLRLKRAKRLAHDIALGLRHMHSYGVFHRDIKLNNIIVMRECPDNCTSRACDKCSFRAKLIDFGASGFYCSIREPCNITIPLYRSPECWAYSYYDDKSDIWSYAVILYHLVLGDLPYIISDTHHPNSALQIIASNYMGDETKDVIVGAIGGLPSRYLKVKNLERDLFSLYGNIDQLEKSRFINLLKQCFRVDPHGRLSAEQIINHPWFTSEHWKTPWMNTKRDEQIIHINDNTSRKTVINYVREMLDRLSSEEKLDHYNYRYICHALRIFDICNTGDLDRPIETFRVCLYIFVKYFSPGMLPLSFENVVGKRDMQLDYRKLERDVIIKKLGCKVYHPSVYEYCADKRNYLDVPLLRRCIDMILDGSAQGMKPSEVVLSVK